MARRSRFAVMLVVVAVLIVAWWGVTRPRAVPSAAKPVAARAISGDFRDALARIRTARGLPAIAPREVESGVTITGHVIDINDAARPVGVVEVVFRGATGEVTAMSDAAGAYNVHVAPGSYRAFVRADAVMSFAREDRIRLPGLPSAASIGVPDEALMTLVRADRDTREVDLAVTGGGVVHGRVVDSAGHPVAGAVVRARSGRAVRPALGTDVSESDRDGRFELRLPAAGYMVDAAHPRFAGLRHGPGRAADLVVDAGGTYDVTFVLIDGCLISGRVVGADGQPAADGAIERELGGAFRPAGTIEPDGTFQLATTDEMAVSLRAWPWKSPPAAAQTFACRPGARFEHVVFQLPDQRPDLEGVLVDQAGEPVAGAFIDVYAMDPGGINQQERSDAQGHWAAYSMPAGHYRVLAHVEGKGIGYETVTSPSTGNRVALRGTGRLEGTTSRLTNGSFDLVLMSCAAGEGAIWLPPSHRLISVVGGHFTIDNLPACRLMLSAIWRGQQMATEVEVPSGGTVTRDLDVGPIADVAPEPFDNPEGGDGLPGERPGPGSGDAADVD